MTASEMKTARQVSKREPCLYCHHAMNPKNALLLPVVCCCIYLSSNSAYASRTTQKHTITVTSRYDTQRRQPAIVRDFLQGHPEVRLEQWDGIRLPVQGFTASLAMAMAGNIGPDIFEMDIRQAVAQGLAHPLTEWIGEDGVRSDGTLKRRIDGSPDCNGQIDADETKWDGWMQIKPILRLVCTVDGKPYALPIGAGTYVGVLYSRRLLNEAGLNAEHPPKDWEEFILWCRLLYNHETDTPAVEFREASWAFAPWVATTGSSILVQDRVSPRTGKTYTFNEQDTSLIAPDTGEDLSNATPLWRCNVADPDAMAAVAFYHRMRWAPWILDQASGDPMELTQGEVRQGWAMHDGRKVHFSKEDVIEGCIGVPTLSFQDTLRRFGRDLAMHPLWAGDLTTFESMGVQPEDLGMMPFPAMTQGQLPVLQNSACFFMVGKDVLHRGGETEEERQVYRDLVWEVLWRICSVEGSNEDIRRKVAAGQGRFLNPRDLKRLGLEDYLEEIPLEYLLMWERIEKGEILEVVEPFTGKWLQFRDFYQREVIDLVLRPSGKAFDYESALEQLERDANSGIMFERPPEELDIYRPRARIVAVLVACVLGFFVVLIVRDQLRRQGSLAGVYRGFLPWIMLLPALGSIAVWRYYPLTRGLVMAFQDYRIVGTSTWAGLNNFISIALDPNFYHYILTTFRFVLWNLALAFFTPILLAVLLTEVPRLKVFFRTLFFLPQMTSGLVVTLLWKEMFAGTASGTINRLFSPILNLFDSGPIDWLGNPRTVMACVILPGVWAGAGLASLIYLAALKSVPEELYEAASIDGAGVTRRAWQITLPTILPLILINFVGAFIATFQSMGGIFLMTFGGPGKETMVLSMAIWQEAYLNLRFHLATSYAWILGSILIGFTTLQLRILRRVDFRRASTE